MMQLKELAGGLGNALQPRLPGAKKPSDDINLVKDLDTRLDNAKEARRPYESAMLVNLSFYFNKQWAVYSQVLGKLELPQVEPWRVMPNINFVRPAVLTSYSKIVGQRQAARTQPVGPNPEDEADARACDKLLDYLWPVTKSEDALKKAELWALICGTGFIEGCWDKTWGPIVGQDPETGAELHLGEVQVYGVSPFEFYGEPGCMEIDEMEWCFHVAIRSASWVKKMYGRDIEDTDYDDTATFETQLKTIISGETAKSKGVLVKRYFERPNSDNPEGRYVVYINDDIVEDMPNPYKKKPLPFIAVRAHPRPDSFWGVSFVDDMIDPQRIYNKTKGESIEIQRLTSKPKRLIPEGSIPPGKQISNAPGEDIRYTPVNGLKPEVEKGADIPQGYFKLLETTRQELYDTSGQHEVSHGQSPFTRTATGIAYLQEQDDTRLSPITRNYDQAFEFLEELKLCICQENYQEERTLRILGKDNKTQLVAFSAESIGDDVHVRIQAGGTALPRSRVARQDLILKLWTTAGANGQPLLDDPKLVLKLFEFGEIEGLYDDINRDVQLAEFENAQMTGSAQPVQPGMPPSPPVLMNVKQYHNHQVHIKEHNKIRNSVSYLDLDPAHQATMDQHVSLHEQILAQQLFNMQANLAASTASKTEAVGGNRGPKPPSGMGSLYEDASGGGPPQPPGGEAPSL